jgi:hypothetical protein
MAGARRAIGTGLALLAAGVAGLVASGAGAAPSLEPPPDPPAAHPPDPPSAEPAAPASADPLAVPPSAGPPAASSTLLRLAIAELPWLGVAGFRGSYGTAGTPDLDQPTSQRSADLADPDRVLTHATLFGDAVSRTGWDRAAGALTARAGSGAVAVGLAGAGSFLAIGSVDARAACAPPRFEPHGRPELATGWVRVLGHDLPPGTSRVAVTGGQLGRSGFASGTLSVTVTMVEQTPTPASARARLEVSVAGRFLAAGGATVYEGPVLDLVAGEVAVRCQPFRQPLPVDPGYPAAPGYPGGTAPAYPGGTAPAYPDGTPPAHPDGTAPAHPGGTAPGYPGSGARGGTGLAAPHPTPAPAAAAAAGTHTGARTGPNTHTGTHTGTRADAGSPVGLPAAPPAGRSGTPRSLPPAPAAPPEAATPTGGWLPRTGRFIPVWWAVASILAGAGLLLAAGAGQPRNRRPGTVDHGVLAATRR